MINYIVDYLSLFAVGKILYLYIPKWRYHTACAVGAIYSSVAFFTGFNFYIHMLLPFVLCAITVGVSRLRKIIVGTITFLTCESFIGGCVIALKNLTNNLLKTREHLFLALLATALLSTIVYFFFQRAVLNRFKMPIVMATLEHEGVKKHLALLIDSGNMARDASTGMRIIFIRQIALKGITVNETTKHQTEILTATGKGNVSGFIPSKITFDDEKYNREKFIIVISDSCDNLHGIDGIVPLIV